MIYEKHLFKNNLHGTAPSHGGYISLSEDGGAVVYNNNNEPIAFVGIPWATDAAGNAVTTWFETDGKTLTQYVQHNVEGVVYPVTADPSWWSWSVWWKVTKCEAAIIAVAASWYFGYRELKALGGATSLAYKIVFKQLTKKQIYTSLGSIAGTIFGVDAIISQCGGLW